MSSFSAGDYYFSTSDAFPMEEDNYVPRIRKERNPVVSPPQDIDVPSLPASIHPSHSLSAQTVQQRPPEPSYASIEPVRDDIGFEPVAARKKDVFPEMHKIHHSAYQRFDPALMRSNEDFYESMDLAASANQVAEQSAVIDSNTSSAWEKMLAVKKLHALVLSGNVGARGGLFKAINSEHKLVQAAAIQAVVECSIHPMDSLEQVDLTRALVRVLEAPEDKVEASTKTVAMQAICHLGGDVDAYSVGVVVAQTQSADASQRRAAVQAMGKLVKPRDVHHISRLVFLLQDLDEQVREQVVRALSTITKLTDERVVTALLHSVSTDASPRVQRTATDCLVAATLQGEEAQAELRAVVKQSGMMGQDAPMLPTAVRVALGL